MLINDLQSQKTIFGCPALLAVIFGYDNVIAHAGLNDLNWKFNLVLFGVPENKNIGAGGKYPCQRYTFGENHRPDPSFVSGAVPLLVRRFPSTMRCIKQWSAALRDRKLRFGRSSFTREAICFIQAISYAPVNLTTSLTLPRPVGQLLFRWYVTADKNLYEYTYELCCYPDI